MKKVILGTLVCGVAAFAAVNLGACKGCHGANFEKKALGKSKIVKDMTKADVSAALVGYKAGTYGGPMKGVMKGQVAKYSEADLKATGLGK
jgi:cytochrome c-type protein NapB